MSIRISLLLPTRGRPDLVKRLFQSILNTTTDLNRIEVILYIDEDDIPSHDLTESGFSLIKIIGPNQAMGKNNHACFERASGDILVLMNDDVIIHTLGWDEKIIQLDAQYLDKIYLGYPNDLFKKSLCTFPILSRKTCELLNHRPYPTVYEGAFIDTHLYDIFQRVFKRGLNRIHYLHDCIFEHVHYRTGKAAYDATYQKRNRFGDDKHFIELINLRQQNANNLVSAITRQSDTMPVSSHVVAFQPAHLLKAIACITKLFLFDRNLPARWKGFLWYWFIGRYLASKGLLWPLVKIRGIKEQ